MLATNRPFAPRSKPFGTKQVISLPKQFRLLRSAEFRGVYREGMRVPSACFRAFCRRRPDADGPRIGLTVPKAVGKSVDRNRIKRRMREAIWWELRELRPEWDVVFNPRRNVLTAPFMDLRREVRRVFRRCKEF